MKKLVSPRIPVYIQAELHAGGKSYSGIIGNLSHSGVFIEIDPGKSAAPFLPRKLVDLVFVGNSGKKIRIHCEIIWLYAKRISSRDISISAGLEINKPPTSYKNFFKSL